MYKFLFLALIISTTIHAEITPPNYDFTLKSIEIFMPGKSIEEVKKQHSSFDVFKESGEEKILRFKLKRANYSLDVYTQVKKEKITDLFVRLPQHFLHDLFLKDLQARFKKQDKFYNRDKSSLYVWLNRDNANVIYQGSCSITCFPMFVEFVSTEPSVIPMYKTLNDSLPRW